MEKAARDSLMTRMTSEERQQFFQLIRDARLQAKAGPGGQVRARAILEAHGSDLSPTIRAALAAVVTRDEMGPQVGDYPADFSLKRLGSDERVQLSSFRGARPVALIFGSYT